MILTVYKWIQYDLKMAHLLPKEQCDFIFVQTQLPLNFAGISEYDFLCVLWY